MEKAKNPQAYPKQLGQLCESAPAGAQKEGRETHGRGRMRLNRSNRAGQSLDNPYRFLQLAIGLDQLLPLHCRSGSQAFPTAR